MMMLNLLTGASAVESAGGACLSVVIQAAIQALKSVLTSPMSRQEKCRGSWNLLLQSALNTLLTFWDSGTYSVTVTYKRAALCSFSKCF